MRRKGIEKPTIHRPMIDHYDCVIWYHLYNLKMVKNIHGVVLLLVKLQAEACLFTKIAVLHE